MQPTSKKGGCPCGESACPGLEQLREYTSWNDLVAHCGEATIVRWVNDYAEKKAAQRFAHKQYNEKKKLMVRAAMDVLSEGEIAELKAQAARKASV